MEDLRDRIKSVCSESRRKGVIVCFFAGKDEKTGESWCGDCRKYVSRERKEHVVITNARKKNRAKPLLDKYVPDTTYIELSRDVYKEVKLAEDLKSIIPKLPTLHRFRDGKSTSRLVEGECYDEALLKKFVLE